MGRLGAVAAIHPLASLVGLDVLREGGNAFDAAVAVSAVVPLGEPHMSGIGGTGAATLYHASSDTCLTLNFRGVLPSALRLEDPRDRDQIIGGLTSAQTPGLVAGWAALLDRYGTIKLDRLLRPAIEYARRGVPVSVMLSAVIEAVGKGTGPYDAKTGEGFTDSRTATLFMPSGRPLQPGELLVQRRLAATLETIANEGPKAFYEGRIAREIADACAAAGAFITLSDLAGVEAEWRPSRHVGYRGYEVHSMGTQTLEALSLLGGFDLEAFGLLSADHIHSVIECIKLSQADQLAHATESDFDPATLLSDEFATRRRSEIQHRATRGLGDEPGGPWGTWPLPVAGVPTQAASHSGTDTTHFVVADQYGNLVSLTQSLGRHFGSRTMVNETGILLNDVSRPYARPGFDRTRGATIVLSPEGAPWMAVGSPGKSFKFVPQMLSHVIDFHLNPQAAVEAPRVNVFEGFRVLMESRMPQATRDELTSRGHDCVVVGEWAFGEGQIGRGQMIVRDASGTLHAASDPRGGGVAQAI
jgi:gamma-glutamyltranspeptidase/glutathione hydrolase